jgi:putative intracellular protease/amidase
MAGKRPGTGGLAMGKTVHIAVYDGLADWEPGHAIAELARRGHRVVAVGADREPVTTMGGLRVLPDLALGELRPADSSLLILPGAGGWDEGDALVPFARAARTFVAAGVPVAAICGATFGLAAGGLLDDRDHTSAAPEYLAASGYRGADRYREADAVTDGAGLVITAGPTEPVAFAREIFARLGTFSPEVLDAWFRVFQHSDAEAYAVLAAAQESEAAARA